MPVAATASTERRGDQTQPEVVSKHQVNPKQVSVWKRWAIEGRGGGVKSRVVCKSERKLLDASVRLPWRPPSVREA